VGLDQPHHETRPVLRPVRHCLSWGTRFAQRGAAAPPCGLTPPVGPPAPGHLCWTTSGTTGAPKGYPSPSHRQLRTRLGSLVQGGVSSAAGRSRAQRARPHLACLRSAWPNISCLWRLPAGHTHAQAYLRRSDLQRIKTAVHDQRAPWPLESAAGPAFEVPSLPFAVLPAPL